MNSINSDKLSAREKFFFGLGDFFGGGAGLLMTVVYFKFLTDVMMIPPGMSGTIVLITKIWDAAIDPVLGVISDNTRTRWGRRRPAIFAGGFLIVAAMAFLFMPVQGWAYASRVVYVTFSWLFFCTVSSYIGVSYSSLSGEISNDYRERNAANAIRLTISQMSTLVCATAPLLIRDALAPQIGVENAYLAVGLIFGCIFGVILILLVVNTKERVPMPAEKSTFEWRTFVKPMKIKCFRETLFMYMFAFLCLDIVTTLFQHFMQYVAHREKETSFVLGALVLVQIATIPVVYTMTKRISKPLIFRFSAPIWLLGAFCLSLYSAAWPPALIYIFAALTGIGVCGCVMMPWMIYPDVVDVGELAFGNRISGSFSGLMTFTRQLSTAVGVALVGWVMQWTGYNATLGTYGQPTSAITGFRGLVIVSAVLLLGISFFFATRNKLNEAKSVIIKRALTCTREGTAMPDELRQDVERIKTELIG
jgi:oligogalacturonide transporter